MAKRSRQGKRRNRAAQDATLINIRAIQKRLDAAGKRGSGLRMKKIEKRLDRVERALASLV